MEPLSRQHERRRCRAYRSRSSRLACSPRTIPALAAHASTAMTATIASHVAAVGVARIPPVSREQRWRPGPQRQPPDDRRDQHHAHRECSGKEGEPVEPRPDLAPRNGYRNHSRAGRRREQERAAQREEERHVDGVVHRETSKSGIDKPRPEGPKPTPASARASRRTLPHSHSARATPAGRARPESSPAASHRSQPT